MNKLISLKKVSRIYNNDISVLDNLNFECDIGDFVAIIGASGAGKTTLMNIIGRLDSKYSGIYFFENEDVMKNKKIGRIGNEISFIFQNYNLIDRLTVYQNIKLSYTFKNYTLRNIDARINEIMMELSINELKNKKINTLSGGEKQRVAIARSMLIPSKLIIADEPTGNLDHGNAVIVMDILKKMCEKNVTVILITHNEDLMKYADKVYYLDKGKLYEKN